VAGETGERYDAITRAIAWVRDGRPPAMIPPAWSVKLALVPLVAFVLLAIAVMVGATSQADAHVSNAVHAQANGVLDVVMLATTTLGYIPEITLIVVAVALFSLRDRRRLEAIVVTGLMTGEGALDAALKLAVHRGRPHPEWAVVISGFSFPSGHAMATTCLLGMLLWLCWAQSTTLMRWLLSIAALVLLLGVGLSRVYLGAHYASDVVGGWLAGLAWLGAVFGAFRRAQLKLAFLPARGQASD
jgi:undecaprenyl-diphosphatase